jgi:hypothetical protein
MLTSAQAISLAGAHPWLRIEDELCTVGLFDAVARMDGRR